MYVPAGTGGQLEGAVGLRHREVAVREDEDERAHVRVDVAEHPHHAGPIEADRLGAPDGIAAEVEAPRRREREHVVVDAVAVREVDDGAGADGEHVGHERLVALVHPLARPRPVPRTPPRARPRGTPRRRGAGARPGACADRSVRAGDRRARSAGSAKRPRTMPRVDCERTGTRVHASRLATATTVTATLAAQNHATTWTAPRSLPRGRPPSRRLRCQTAFSSTWRCTVQPPPSSRRVTSASHVTTPSGVGLDAREAQVIDPAGGVQPWPELVPCLHHRRRRVEIAFRIGLVGGLPPAIPHQLAANQPAIARDLDVGAVRLLAVAARARRARAVPA